MQKNKYKQIVTPELQDQTLFQLSQLRNFVDSSIYEVVLKNYKDDKEKIKFMLDTLFNIRYFVLTATSSNSLRVNLLNEFEKIENEEKASESLGNVQEKSENQEGW